MFPKTHPVWTQNFDEIFVHQKIFLLMIFLMNEKKFFDEFFNERKKKFDEFFNEKKNLLL